MSGLDREELVKNSFRRRGVEGDPYSDGSVKVFEYLYKDEVHHVRHTRTNPFFIALILWFMNSFLSKQKQTLVNMQSKWSADESFLKFK